MFEKKVFTEISGPKEDDVNEHWWHNMHRSFVTYTVVPAWRNVRDNDVMGMWPEWVTQEMNTYFYGETSWKTKNGMEW
jgi:hypothetical protein